MAVLFQVEVFWVVTPCSVMVRYQHSTGPCCLLTSPWGWRQHGALKRQYITRMLHGVTTQTNSN